MPCYTYADQKLEIGHHFSLGKRGWEGWEAWEGWEGWEAWEGWEGVSHGFQRKRRGDQSSLTEFKGGTKENWRPMR